MSEYSKEEIYNIILDESKKLNENFNHSNHEYIAKILDDKNKTVEEKIAGCMGSLYASQMKYTEALLAIVLDKVL